MRAGTGWEGDVATRDSRDGVIASGSIGLRGIRTAIAWQRPQGERHRATGAAEQVGRIRGDGRRDRFVDAFITDRGGHRGGEGLQAQQGFPVRGGAAGGIVGTGGQCEAGAHLGFDRITHAITICVGNALEDQPGADFCRMRVVRRTGRGILFKRPGRAHSVQAALTGGDGIQIRRRQGFMITVVRERSSQVTLRSGEEGRLCMTVREGKDAVGGAQRVRDTCMEAEVRVCAHELAAAAGHHDVVHRLTGMGLIGIFSFRQTQAEVHRVIQKCVNGVHPGGRC